MTTFRDFLKKGEELENQNSKDQDLENQDEDQDLENNEDDNEDED